MRPEITCYTHTEREHTYLQAQNETNNGKNGDCELDITVSDDHLGFV
jgi:hypothetical protein